MSKSNKEIGFLRRVAKIYDGNESLLFINFVNWEIMSFVDNA